MSNNIFEQLVEGNNKLLVFTNEKPLSEQADESNRLISKIIKNKKSIDPTAKEAVVYVATNKNATNNDTVDVIANNLVKGSQEASKSANEYISSVKQQDAISSAASRVEYRVAKEIDNVYIGSTAKEIYNFKKDPNAVESKTDIYKILQEEAERYSNNINYINNSNASATKNLQTAKELLK
jgi:hypothetical protein